MPPKSQIGFSLGPAGESFTDETTRALPMFELAPNGDPWGTNSQQSTTAESAVPTLMPRSVSLKPMEPTVVKGNGPTLQIRQLWEGTVTDVSAEGFVATLRDRTRPTNPDEQAAFEFESIEVQEDDKPLVKPGSVFYLMMGKETAHSGQVRTVSSVEFRRLPAWTRSSLDGATARAASLKEWFAFEK